MKRIILFFSIISIVLLSNCSIEQDISEEEKQQISTEIKNRLQGYSNALQLKDLEWFQGFWSNEADFVFAGDGQLKTDYDATITQACNDLFHNLKEVLHFKFSNDHITVLNKDAASYVVNFDWGMLMHSGDTVQSKGSWLYVFKKSNDQWRVVHSAGTHNYY